MFSKRHIECLYWAREGKSSTDIGTILGISPYTVDEHFANICERLGVRTRTQAVAEAIRLGLLPPSTPRSGGGDGEPDT